MNAMLIEYSAIYLHFSGATDQDARWFYMDAELKLDDEKHKCKSLFWIEYGRKKYLWDLTADLMNLDAS